MSRCASTIVEIARNWVGCKESNGTHKVIIDLYNRYKPLARGYKVKYTDSWCATFVSACAIKAGFTSIIPTECSCSKMIELFKKINSWVENDGYIPKAGDIIFYDWNDTGKGDNKGHSDHVGIVERCDGKNIVVIEGNKNESVSRRNIAVNGRYIRGYGVPKYDNEVDLQKIAKEVIAGKWGNGANRKIKLRAAGYDYKAVQSIVNQMLH